MPEADYLRLKDAVEAAGFFTSFQRISHTGYRLILASKKRPLGDGLTGNSFWVMNRHGRWIIATWGPFYYEMPPGTDPAEACIAWLRTTDRTCARIDKSIIRQYGLILLSDDEVDQLFPESA